MIKILFTGKEHRVRRRETMLNPPEGMEFIPQQPLELMKKDYQLSNYKDSRTIFNKIRDAIYFGNFIPPKYLKGINLIYSPGKLVLNKFPHVIELDNIAALAYYNTDLLTLLKPFIKLKLESKYCKRIICISEATKKGMMNFFTSKKINKKLAVVYPYIKNHKKEKRKKKKIRLLFISTNFYLKGGKELVNSFNKLSRNYKNIEMTIITKLKNITKKDLKKIKSNPRINIFEASFSKQELYKKIYPRHDIFVLPTYQDSFGMVYLEAISFGMPCIGTNTYSIPEIIKKDINGFLIDPPIYYFHKKTFLPNKKVWRMDLTKFAKTNKFPKVEKQLQYMLKKFIENPALIKKMSESSEIIFKKIFYPRIRKKRLSRALKLTN